MTEFEGHGRYARKLHHVYILSGKAEKYMIFIYPIIFICLNIMTDSRVIIVVMLENVIMFILRILRYLCNSEFVNE